ncbi:transposase [Paraphaeosphaeria minitans]|uniref:Transposase n=1 Tax=Paraphaeosphaeria minitans TaxID=565426 RepID=A0A9P6KKX1_9PLEO|nr:transposase [Paraphaeosphaeria minitans]
MKPQQHHLQSSKEGRINLAIASYQSNPSQSLRRLAASFDVPRSTLQTRLYGIKPKRETVSVNRKLRPIEEQSLVDWILDLNQRGFPPHIIDVRRMADHLLAARGQIPPPLPVGQKWVSRFIKTQPDLQTKWTRSFHSQRALCEDPVKISYWYKLVEECPITWSSALRGGWRTCTYPENGVLPCLACIQQENKKTQNEQSMITFS